MARRHHRRPQNNYYDIQFLNDLHTHFPDLLYNIDRFFSVRDVLLYIRSQSRRRYNRFDQAEEEYDNTYYPISQINTSIEPQEVLLGGAAGRAQAQRRQQSQQSQQQQRQPRFPARGHFQTRAQPQTQIPRRTDHIRTPITQRLPTVNTPLTTFSPLFDFNTFGLGNGFTTFTTFPPAAAPNPGTADTTQAEIDGATALLTLLGLTTTPNTLFPNMTPVIVRPTQDIINHATVLETIQEPAPAGICVICQDEYAVGNSVRRIRHCQHLFHNDCIMQHFDSSVRCPTCRHDIRDFLSH